MIYGLQTISFLRLIMLSNLNNWVKNAYLHQASTKPHYINLF